MAIPADTRECDSLHTPGVTDPLPGTSSQSMDRTRAAVVELSLDDDRYNGSADPAAFREVVIGGEVVCGSSTATLTEVTLEAATDEGWSTVLEDDSFSFGPQGGSEDFTLTITIPASAPAGFTDTVRVGGMAESTPGGETADLEEVTAEVEADQYFALSAAIDSVNSNVEAHPGDRLDLALNVTNLGNGRDLISVELSGMEELTGAGWEFGFDVTSAWVDAGETWDVAVAVDIPEPGDDGAELDNITGYHTIAFIFNSSGIDPLTGEVVNLTVSSWLRVIPAGGDGGGDGVDGGGGIDGMDGEAGNGDDGDRELQEDIRRTVGWALLAVIVFALAAFALSGRRGRTGEGAGDGGGEATEVEVEEE